jgi:DNA-binding LacI/PurR family transcriptional regulator
MSGQRPVTIIDVAKQSGTSPSTVSRVINRSGYVSESTLKKVGDAIDALDYRPNWAARGLKGGPTKLIGLIIPDISNVFYTALAQGVGAVLNQSGYEMILCVNDENQEKDLGFLRILEEKRVDGILYTHPAEGSNSETLRDMVARGMPVVEVNRQRENDLLDVVLADNLRGAQQGTDYLLELGHRRIGVIIGSTITTTGSERTLGYKTSMAKANLPVDQDLLKIGSFTSEWGEQATTELLNLPDPPTAIFATSNRIALGALKAVNRSNLRIPDDLSFIAFDDPEWLVAWNPPITVVDVATSEMAKLAVKLLVGRIAKDKSKPVAYHLGTSLVKRQSCKALSQKIFK